MHRNKFGEYFFRTVPLDIIEGPHKVTFVSLAILLEPNEYNMVDIDIVWKIKATEGYLGEWEFNNYDYLIRGVFFYFNFYEFNQNYNKIIDKLKKLLFLTETNFVPLNYKSYLISDELRSKRVSDSKTLWIDIGLPAVAGKQITKFRQKK